jgi:prepilin-type N-terminal cleavage/methylation domain-containing protein
VLFSGSSNFGFRAIVHCCTLAAATVAWSATAAWAGETADSTAVPACIAALSSFRGRVDYTMHRTDVAGAAISGSLLLGTEGWTLTERSLAGTLHASNEQSWIQPGARAYYFDDALTLDTLGNAWLVLLAQSAGQPVRADPSGQSWMVGPNLRVYQDSRGHIAGLVDARPDADVSFSFDDWLTVNGLTLPQTIVRLQHGLVDAAFAVDSYQVSWAATTNGTAAAAFRSLPIEAATEAPSSMPPSETARAWRWFGGLFALLFCGIVVAAWFRRDALVNSIGRLVLDDPRAFCDEGVSVFVSPEGILSFEGRRYRVGSDFFNRATRVQSSPLFLRISAPGTSRTLLIARKFSAPWLGVRRHARGFTLIESMVATAVFATIIVAAVLPTFIVLAQADRAAALHETAAQVAANTLVDEESALEYLGASGRSISDTSATTTIDGMQVTVTVSPSTPAAMHQVTVLVNHDSELLASIASMVGPPVPAPAGSPGPPAAP